MNMKEKLVRDRIPEIIKREGREPTVRIAGEKEFPVLLHKKLLEETGEFTKKPSVDELSDVLEVVLALAGEMGITWEQLESAANKKREQKGGFVERIVLKG
ncbi:MAG: nucleoside triphosphate pyrophosphohydrolase [Candidatus Aenigmatarchaeota archaeon]